MLSPKLVETCSVIVSNCDELCTDQKEVNSLICHSDLKQFAYIKVLAGLSALTRA